MAETTGDKTEQATPKKLEEAFNKGQVARSAEVQTAFVLMAFAQVLIRVGIMQFRRVSLESSGSPVHNAVPS